MNSDKKGWSVNEWCDLAPTEAQSISGVVETWRKSIETVELVQRIEALEQRE